MLVLFKNPCLGLLRHLLCLSTFVFLYSCRPSHRVSPFNDLETLNSRNRFDSRTCSLLQLSIETFGKRDLVVAMAHNYQMPMFGRAGTMQVADAWNEVDHIDVDMLAEYLLDDGALANSNVLFDFEYVMRWGLL